MIRMWRIYGLPVVIENVDAVIVKLVGQEGVRDKELANKEGQDDEV